MENSVLDLDVDLDSEEIDNVVTNTVIYQNNFGFMRNQQNTFIARFNDISINTFILSPGSPINIVLRNNIKQKYQIDSSSNKNIVIHKKQDPSFNNIDCCCCMDSNKKLSFRAYRSCKAAPKHTICNDCFQFRNLFLFGFLQIVFKKAIRENVFIVFHMVKIQILEENKFLQTIGYLRFKN